MRHASSWAPGLHVVRRRHRAGGRDRDRRLADGAARDDRHARRPGRQVARPVPRRLSRPGGESRAWAAVIDGVLRRPLLWGGLAAALLIALAIPALRIHTVDSGAQGLPRDLPVMQIYERAQRAFPGGPLPAEVVVRRPTSPRRRSSPASRARAPGAGHRPDGEGLPGTGQRLAPRPRGRHPARRQRHRRHVEPRARPAARGRDPGHDRSGSRRRGAHHGADRRLARLQRFDEGARADRVRVRVLAGVPAAAHDVPLDRHPDHGDRAQHALGRRRLRRAGADLPEGQPRVAAGLPLDRRRDLMAAAVPVRDPVRALDGLPRADPQPHARVPRRGSPDRRRGGARAARNGERRHERRGRDGRGVRDLRDPRDDRLQDDGRRSGGGGPDRRDARARRARPGHHEAARRLELVPAEPARVAAQGGSARAVGRWWPQGSLTTIREMPGDATIAQVRRFNRTVTQRVGALSDRFLARDRPLGASRLLWEIGVEGCEVRALRSRLGLDSGQVSRLPARWRPRV